MITQDEFARYFINFSPLLWWKWIEATNENSNFDLRVWRVNTDTEGAIESVRINRIVTQTYNFNAPTLNNLRFSKNHIENALFYDRGQCRAQNIGLRLLEYYSLNTYPIQALFVHLITWHEFNVNNRHVRRVFLQPPKLADTKPNKKLGRLLDNKQQQKCIY